MIICGYITHGLLEFIISLEDEIKTILQLIKSQGIN